MRALGLSRRSRSGRSNGRRAAGLGVAAVTDAARISLVQLSLAGGEAATAHLTRRPAAGVDAWARTRGNMRGTCTTACAGHRSITSCVRERCTEVHKPLNRQPTDLRRLRQARFRRQARSTQRRQQQQQHPAQQPRQRSHRAPCWCARWAVAECAAPWRRRLRGWGADSRANLLARLNED